MLCPKTKKKNQFLNRFFTFHFSWCPETQVLKCRCKIAWNGMLTKKGLYKSTYSTVWPNDMSLRRSADPGTDTCLPTTEHKRNPGVHFAWWWMGRKRREGWGGSSESSGNKLGLIWIICGHAWPGSVSPSSLPGWLTGSWQKDVHVLSIVRTRVKQQDGKESGGL